MKVLIVDNGSSYINNLHTLVSEHEVELCGFGETSIKKQSQFDLIILSGGHIVPVASDDGLYNLERELIRMRRKPMLGLCLGFELIAHTFGAKLIEKKLEVKGLNEIVPVNDDPIFEGLNKIMVYESHRWVVGDLPSDLTPLAKSQDGIEIIKKRDLPIYGFQFHPELVKNSKDGKILFDNFINLINE
jgi:anthranilate/para-aminobenzoate synthase component II